MEANGLGDTIEWITIKTGIKKIVPKNCSCDKRRKKLNKLVPYKLVQLKKWKKN